MIGTQGDFIIYAPHLWNLFFADYLGRGSSYFDYLDPETQKRIMDSDEYRTMGVWLKRDSVRMIENVIVVKLSD